MAPHPQPKSVIIVGGSLGGLMHALSLLSLPNPPKVRILERSPTQLLHNQGAGIVAQSDTNQYFDRYVQPGRPIVVTSALRQYLNRKGDIIDGSIDKREQHMTSWDLVYHLLRWRVDGLESDYIKESSPDNRPKAVYEHGCTITNVEDIGEQGVKVTWTNKDIKEEQSTIADLIIAADGPSSTIRRLLDPEVKREYAGYVAWRGTVPENELSDNAKETFIEKFNFYHSEGIQILGYTIPGTNGTLETGSRLMNWVWYCNYKEGSSELDELMTDVNGKRHPITLPVGSMQPQVWEKQKKYASNVLPPQFAEAISKTRQPFIQAITDVISSRNSYMDGKVLLVGDALAGFRPHTAASTSQAAFDAHQLGRWLTGKISQNEYDDNLLDYAKELQERGVKLGDRSQFGSHPLAG